MSRLKNKGQSGETMTWIIATIIIIVILLVSVYASYALAKGKKAVTLAKNPSLIKSGYSFENDLILLKSLTGFLSTKQDQEIYYKLKNENFDNVNGQLAKQIFTQTKDNYNEIWVGIDKQGNDYFGEEPNTLVKNNVKVDIKLNTKTLGLIAVK